MKTTQKVKIQTTTATIAVIYNDNSNAIKNIQIVGKYTLSNAKKYFKKEWLNTSPSAANVVTVEVLKVDHVVVEYTVDTVALNNFCNEYKIDEKIKTDTVTENDNE